MTVLLSRHDVLSFAIMTAVLTQVREADEVACRLFVWLDFPITSSTFSPTRTTCATIEMEEFTEKTPIIATKEDVSSEKLLTFDEIRTSQLVIVDSVPD